MSKPHQDSIDIEREIFDLRQQIEQHNYRYHLLDNPLISDTEYYELFRRLVELEKDHPEFASADSTTQNVGAAPLPSFKTVTHTLPMLSLSNATDQEEMEEFQERI